MRIVVVLLVAVLVALFERGRVAPRLVVIQRALESRWAPLVFGLAFGSAAWWTWGEIRPIGGLHDELAYLLQAHLFRDFRWTAPGPPMPEFFAQAHVLNDPLVASKYPPGHSLLLSIGDHFGMPVLVVIALAVLRGALTYALARRLTNGAIALGTGVLLMHGQSLYFAASYFSETTTGALLLLGWYGLLRWREEGARGWIALVAFSLGWCAITRPFSAVLFAVPIAYVVLRHVMQSRKWRDLAVALAVGSAVVAIIPLWAVRTTGDWRLWPATVYTRDFMPYDRPHFGYDATPPRKTPPPDVAYVNASLDSVQKVHTVAALPSIARDRWTSLAAQSWWAPVPEGALALIGLFVAPPATLVGVATTAIVFLGYLAHPTWSTWTVYYMEIAPVLAFLTMCGFALLLRVLAREPERAQRWAEAPRSALALAVALVFCIPMLRVELRFNRYQHLTNASYPGKFRLAVSRLPAHSLLFVRHAKFHEPDWSLVINDPDFASARTWIAYDRGDSANMALLRRVPDRSAFLFDESRRMIGPYQPPRLAAVP
jgi:hypothetical protein